jgi:hypothetical protein
MGADLGEESNMALFFYDTGDVTWGCEVLFET